MPTPARYLPSLEEIDAVIRHHDPELRNLKITLTYHDIEVAMSSLLGGENVCWCAFAVWASRTAGRFIREELPTFVGICFNALSPKVKGLRQLEKRITDLLPGGSMMHDVVMAPLENVIVDSALDVAAGNLKVFAELAPIFRRYISLLEKSQRYDEAELAAFVATLRPGPVEDGEGQDLLIRAFSNYYAAKYEPDRARKAQLMFLANNQIGFHEQTRLQGPIVASISAPIQTKLFQALTGSLRPKVPRLLHGTVEGILEQASKSAFDGIAEEWRLFATKMLMTLGLPDILLDLGKDIPLLDGVAFPPDLMAIEVPELSAMMLEMDRSRGNLQGTGARDWSDLLDRMSSIINLFRSRQQFKRLWDLPFEDWQVEDLRKDIMPKGGQRLA